MKKVKAWVLISGLSIGLSTFGAEEADNLVSEHVATTNMMDAADDLWAGMHEQGMIDDEQYQYVQEHGHLPGGTSVTNSPITAEAQGDWNKLAKEEVITPDELAAMLFDGDIPGLTEEEEQDFVELAPVYQPKRAKRLTHDLRRKHARVELIRLGHRLSKEREALEERGQATGDSIGERGGRPHPYRRGRPSILFGKPRHGVLRHHFHGRGLGH
jgi:hypothetical protein